MSEVSTRPTIIDEATIKDVSLTYDFPSITTWRVDNMSYDDLNIQGVNKFFTDSSERQAVRFNNTDYVFNGILLTKQGDIFTNTNLDGGMIISVYEYTIKYVSLLQTSNIRKQIHLQQ